MRKVNADDLIEFKRLYNSGFYLREIVPLVDFGYDAIKRNLRKSGVNLVNKGIFKRKYYLGKETYFDNIDSQEKAYFLGLLCADGNVYKNRVKLTLESKDCYIIQKFADCLETSKPVQKKSYPSHQGCETCNLEIVSDIMVSSLLKLGVTPNKSLTLCLPTIDDHLISHFIRGYFDGDGCFTFGGRKGTHNNAYFSIVGSLSMISSVQDILMIKCCLNKTKLIPQGNVYYVMYGGNKQVRRIAEFLYKDSTVLLTRKYEKIKHLLI